MLNKLGTLQSFLLTRDGGHSEAAAAVGHGALSNNSLD